ncbi:MAG: type II/IV secretion system protein, partial [Myxococcales bacterium]|nr:type II/IV secretion system protein [Myxococcales bacterium]
MLGKGSTTPGPSVSAPQAPAADQSASPLSSTLPEGTIPFVDVTRFRISRDLLDLVPAEIIIEQRLLPLEIRGKKLVVGMCNPGSLSAERDLLRVLQSVDPEYVAISQDAFYQTVQRLQIEGTATGVGSRSTKVKPTYLAEHKKQDEIAQVVVGDQVIDLLDQILMEGMEHGASGIHVQPEGTGVQVRFRVKGRLVERREPIPLAYAKPLAARCKVLADLDISERRLPQDGRIVAQVGRREINFRISTMLSERGEKVVIRILDPADVMRPFSEIFADPRAERLADAAISAPSGAILVAGASGSGKTSTLYSLINQRKIVRPNDHICTVEDPVEYLFPGFTQSSLNHRIGLGYPQALHALMRQDPDVLMVGDLRDAETTTLTLEASLTGHLVAGSLHGSSVGAVIQRLEHLGTNRVILSQALSLVMVQRLVPRLCELCAKPEQVGSALLQTLVAAGLTEKGASPLLARPTGCDACQKTGYQGRVAVVEALRIHGDVE